MPMQGYWYFVSLVILVVITDLYTYTFHRFQHAIPFLWAMHSFHHSANALTLATGSRHLWMETVMTSAILPIIPILFQIPPDMLLIISLIHFFPDSCAHLNVRFPMGRMITWVNSPQWHRIHHSVLPEHRDKNFASVLPLWDILFGTAWIPKPDEYPVTGLDPPVRVSVIRWRHLAISPSTVARDRLATLEVADDRPVGRFAPPRHLAVADRQPGEPSSTRSCARAKPARRKRLCAPTSVAEFIF